MGLPDGCHDIIETFSAVLALVQGIHWLGMYSWCTGTIMLSLLGFLFLNLDERLNKRPRIRWFKTPYRSCGATVMFKHYSQTTISIDILTLSEDIVSTFQCVWYHLSKKMISFDIQIFTINQKDRLKHNFVYTEFTVVYTMYRRSHGTIPSFLVNSRSHSECKYSKHITYWPMGDMAQISKFQTHTRDIHVHLEDLWNCPQVSTTKSPWWSM